jgi:deoxyribodipyrimidine photo-lyase
VVSLVRIIKFYYVKIHPFWFRRDLRLHDNAGFYRALRNHSNVLPIFIFDRNILDKLDDKKDRRVEFIHQVITDLNTQLKAFGSGLLVKYGTPETVFPELLSTYDIEAVYTNHDFESYAIERDNMVHEYLQSEELSSVLLKIM